MYYVYFLKSIKNKKIYVGYTDKSPKDRLFEHNSGSNIWTKQNGPLNLIYFEQYNCKEDAIKREKFYKMGFGKRVKYAIIQALNKESGD